MTARIGGWLGLVVAVSYTAVGIGGDDWPQFRGTGGNGLAGDSKLPLEWGADKNVQWKVKVDGIGWSAPIIWGERLFVTTAVTENQPKPKSGPRGGGGMGRAKGPPDAVYRWQVHCLERGTGKELWKQVALEAKPRIPKHGSNTYATETPVTDGKHVYAYFGMTGLFCYDFAGKLIWKKDLGSYPMMAGWGTASSPVLDGDRLFIQCDNEEKSFLVALNKKTGEELWRVNRDEKSTWSTPYLWHNQQRIELVALGETVRSYDPASGKVLWELALGSGRASATPVGDADRLYVGLGARGRGRAGGGQGQADSPPGSLYAIQAGAQGKLAAAKGEGASAGIAWSRPKAGPSAGSPLVYQGFVYILDRSGMLSCFDAKTGKPAFERERLPGGRGFWASPWGCGGKVYCLDEEGQTFILAAGGEFKVLGTNRLNDMFWSSPAVAGGSLFLRGVDQLYCIKE